MPPWIFSIPNMKNEHAFMRLSGTFSTLFVTSALNPNPSDKVLWKWIPMHKWLLALFLPFWRVWILLVESHFLGIFLNTANIEVHRWAPQEIPELHYIPFKDEPLDHSLCCVGTGQHYHACHHPIGYRHRGAVSPQFFKCTRFTPIIFGVTWFFSTNWPEQNQSEPW